MILRAAAPLRRIQLALLLAGALAGCSGDVCSDIDGRSFLSKDELECGLTPTGVGGCHWKLRFEGGKFHWDYSDISESGDYTCEDGALTGKSPTFDRTYEGRYDDASGELTWDGVLYVAD